MDYLLSDDVQGASTCHAFPVTESGVRKLLEASRYAYYDSDTYADIGSPTAQLRPPEGIQLGEVVMTVPLSPLFCTGTQVDPQAYFDEVLVYDRETGGLKIETYEEVQLEDAEITAFLAFLNSCSMKAGTDDTVLAIVEEELSFWEGGVTSIEDAAKKIQSRVQIYLNE